MNAQLRIAMLLGVSASLSLTSLQAQELTRSDSVSIVATAISEALTGRTSGEVISEGPTLCVDVPWASDSATLFGAVGNLTDLVVHGSKGCVLETGSVHGGYWVDRESGQRALRVEASGLKLAGDPAVLLTVGITATDAHTQFHSCEARRETNAWTVVCESELIH